MNPALTILDYSPNYQSSIRTILTKIGWAEQYISSAEQNMQTLSGDSGTYGTYVAVMGKAAVGFLYVQYYAWN